MNVIVLGPAGSGKSTLVSALSDYLRDAGDEVKTVNLDPASPPPYRADKDVRDFVRAEEVMRKEKLGINGALIRSMDLSLNYVDELLVKADFVLYDTPGQMELFIYLNSGVEIARRIAESDYTVGLFVVDSGVASTPENFVSVLAQNAVVSLRMDVPVITVFNKADVCRVPFSVEEVRRELEKREGVLAELMEGLVDFLEVTSAKYRIIEVSVLKGEGIEDVLSAINEAFCSCGDLS